MAVQWFQSYFTGRSFKVFWKGGSVLDPLLFLIYTTSLSLIKKAHSFSCGNDMSVVPTRQPHVQLPSLLSLDIENSPPAQLCNPSQPVSPPPRHHSIGFANTRTARNMVVGGIWWPVYFPNLQNAWSCRINALKHFKSGLLQCSIGQPLKEHKQASANDPEHGSASNLDLKPLSNCSCLKQIQGFDSGLEDCHWTAILQVYVPTCNLNEWRKTVLHIKALSLLLDGTNCLRSPNLLRPSLLSRIS